MLRLLNRAEYDRTIEDLFGFPSSWGAGLTPENVLHGFDNQAEALTVPALLAEQLRDAAEAIATQAMGDLDTLLPCDPEADGEEACRDAFITAFGKRAFRRPMTALEVERYGELHSLTALDDGFSGGVEAVVAAVLQGAVRARNHHPIRPQPPKRLPKRRSLLRTRNPERRFEKRKSALTCQSSRTGRPKIVRPPLRQNFMFPVPLASVPASEICSERSAAGMIRSALVMP